MSKRDEFPGEWIAAGPEEIWARSEAGVLTLRGLHYQLVSLGMTNSIRHYKRVVAAMIKARREGLIGYHKFSDHDREAIGWTAAAPTSLERQIERGKEQIQAWMTAYSRNRWENQERFVELWIEKKALQGVFESVTRSNDVALCPCKGYPSLTFLNEAALRFQRAAERGQIPTMVYFGDHDPSGEDIPRAIGENLRCDFGIEVDVQVKALHAQQCLDLGLPPAPVKAGDSRSAGFTGLGQIELDAVRPETLQECAQDSIARNFDQGLYDKLIDDEHNERAEYQAELKEYVSSL